jgi:hypothetical protein
MRCAAVFVDEWRRCWLGTGAVLTYSPSGLHHNKTSPAICEERQAQPELRLLLGNPYERGANLGGLSTHEPAYAFPRHYLRSSRNRASRYPFEMRCTKAGLRLAIPMIHSNMVHVPTREGTASASRNPLTICLYIAQVRTGPSTMSRREWQQSLLSTVTTPHNRLQAHRQVTTGDSHTP